MQSDKIKITKDWEELFPTLKKYKTLHLGNRVEPLVMEIYLKVVRNYVYTPIFSVHNLCREFPCFTMTLTIEGWPMEPMEHEQKYKEIAEKLKQKIYFPLEGDLRIDEIITGYERYFKEKEFYSSDYTEYEDLVLICGWTRQSDKIEYALKVVYKELRKRSEDRYFAENGGFENWFKNLEKQAWNGQMLDEIYKSELEKHKAEKIPERKLVY